MDNTYIKIHAIYNKLRLAETSGSPLYLSAPVGYGKTAAIRYYYRNKEALWLCVEEGKLTQQPCIEAILEQTIIIDDISWITDESSRKYIKNLIDIKKQIVMSGRARLPEWLKTSCTRSKFVLADKKDLEMDEDRIGKLMEAYGVCVSEEQLSNIKQDTYGHALSILMLAYQLQNYRSYTEVAREAARQDTFQYYNYALCGKWTQEMCELLMAMANFDSFSVELAERVTEKRQAMNIFNMAMEVGDFLIKHENGNYEMIPTLRKFLLCRQSLEENNEQLRVYYVRAAQYYESKGKVSKALLYFKKSEEKEEIARLLTINAEKHPGTGHYFETREYYFSLSTEQIKKSAVLMSGISMLYSLMMQPENSELWYKELQFYEGNADNNEEQRREARRRLIYLDIALPHKGTMSMLDILKKVAGFITNKKMTIPEVSLTSNLPSILNGGKDFCEWSKSDRELARVIKVPVALILGKWGAGLVNIALAESLFEKGQADIYEIMTLLNSGYAKADNGGKIEMCFVATAILCRIHIYRFQLKVARNQLQEFKRKVKKEAAERLLPNINAFENWIDLLEGNHNEIRTWLNDAAPDENLEFYILNRYQYLIKVRTYLALEQYEAAANLIERLSVYFKDYKRTYMDMENKVLKAILQYRMKLGDWKVTLSQALIRAEEYHFIYLIAKEGAAIMPLLREMGRLPVEEDFENELLHMAEKTAQHYPNYLKVQEKLTDELTDAERQVLHLYCQGLDTKQVCELCRFTYNTLKFHNKNLYRKLGVSNRLEAERKAGELGL